MIFAGFPPTTVLSSTFLVTTAPAATNIAESVGSLFGSNKVKTLERENTALHLEVATHEETIENLQAKIQTMQHDHSRQLFDMQQKHRMEMAERSDMHRDEVSGLKRIIEKLHALFPMAKEIMRMDSLCRLVGFDDRQTKILTDGKPLIYEGRLYSEEHNRSFTTEEAGFQVVKDPADKSKLVLAINRQPIGEWFRQQFDRPTAEHTTANPTAKEKQGNEAIIGLLH